MWKVAPVVTIMAGREAGETGEPRGMLGGVGFGMSRAFFGSLRSFVRRDLVRVLPLALPFRRGGGDGG